MVGSMGSVCYKCNELMFIVKLNINSPSKSVNLSSHSHTVTPSTTQHTPLAINHKSTCSYKQYYSYYSGFMLTLQ